MINSSISENFDFPINFWKIILRGARLYKEAFAGYFVLTVLTYLPFLVFDYFSPVDVLDLIDFIHGHFLDIIIFITLPTVYLQHKVFPFATLSLFQRFFTSAVVISLIQFGVLWIFIGFFASISLGLFIVGMIPYIFLIFAGFYLILDSEIKLFNVIGPIINSFTMVRGGFFPIFWSFLNISILISAPLFLFSLVYLTNHADWVAFFAPIAEDSPAEATYIVELLRIVQNIMQEPPYKIGRISIHILFRPLKSLFLCFLFLGILSRISPEIIQAFLKNPDIEPEAEVSSTTPETLNPSTDSDELKPAAKPENQTDDKEQPDKNDNLVD